MGRTKMWRQRADRGVCDCGLSQFLDGTTADAGFALKDMLRSFINVASDNHMAPFLARTASSAARARLNLDLTVPILIPRSAAVLA